VSVDCQEDSGNQSQKIGLSAIAVRPKGTSELILEGVKNAVGCGMDGITRGHYDGAEFPILLAIRVCLDAKDVHRPAKLLLA
jgi:hypothetical protein